MVLLIFMKEIWIMVEEHNLIQKPVCTFQTIPLELFRCSDAPNS